MIKSFKLFESSFNIMRDIKEMSYILEDEGYEIIVTDHPNKIITILIQKPGYDSHYSIYNYHLISRWAENLKETDQYLEYIDRIKSIYSKYQYRTPRILYPQPNALMIYSEFFNMSPRQKRRKYLWSHNSHEI